MTPPVRVPALGQARQPGIARRERDLGVALRAALAGGDAGRLRALTLYSVPWPMLACPSSVAAALK